MLEETHCRLAFLRGAFLAGGSVTDPQKGYHLELATTHLRVSPGAGHPAAGAGLRPQGDHPEGQLYHLF